MDNLRLPSLLRMRHCSWMMIWRKKREGTDMLVAVQALVLPVSQMAIGYVLWSTAIVQSSILLTHLPLGKYHKFVNFSIAVKLEVVLDWALPPPILRKVLPTIETQWKRMHLNMMIIRKMKRLEKNLLLFPKWIGLNSPSTTSPLFTVINLIWLPNAYGKCFPTS